MRVGVRVFRCQKAGNALEDYEDACAPAESSEIEGRVVRAAIADGATETSFSGLWADLLVRAYTDGALTGSLRTRAFARLRAAWWDVVGNRPLPWYAEEKLRAGAFSSLTGVTLRAHDGGARWNALAIGDSCLFVVRDGELLAAFPLDSSEQFTSRPVLLSTNTGRLASTRGHVARAGGHLLEGDILYLMTDAVAAWFLARYESGEQPWRCLGALGSEEEFLSLVSDARAGGAMRNDDVSVIELTVRQSE